MLTSLQHLTWLSSDLSTVQLYVRLTVSDPLYIKHNFSLYCDDEVNSCREVSEVRVNLRKTHLPPLNVEDAGRTLGGRCPARAHRRNCVRGNVFLPCG